MAGIDDISIVSPTYNIYKLGRLFKIVKFKNTVCTVKSVVDKPSKLECNHYSDKLACSLSRTRRVILEKALCNPWTWFCTFTVDKDKFDRDDLAVFQKAFTQFIRDERKRGFQIAYLLVPELHKDMQNWHMHGFLYGNPELVSFKEWRKDGHKVPNKLVSGGFYTWPRYHNKFGFCSLGRIRSHVRSAFYISKYMSKDNARLVSTLSKNMYFSSTGLNTAVKHCEVYGSEPALDKYLEKEFEFCSVGMTRLSDRLDWTFGLEFAEIPLDMFESVFDDLAPSGGFWEDMSAIQFEQLSFD